MRILFRETLTQLDSAFEALEKNVPPPQIVQRKGGFVYRYVERSVQQAIILKLARVVSGLRAALLLLENGYVQEQAAMQRLIDELQEDIQFFVFALTIDEVTDLHVRFLDAFFEEEFNDDDDPLTSKQRRPMIPRRKIRAYLTSIETPQLSRSDANNVSRTISKAYSGYVHAAAPHIMEMYGGKPRRFHLDGMLGTPRILEHANDLWNYFFRGLLAFRGAAYAFEDADLAKQLEIFQISFESASEVKYRQHGNKE
jgi:hypothetical protein